MAKGGYYAVANGRKVGIFGSWDECRAQVDGYPQARYKKFVTVSEALAFIDNYRLGCTSGNTSSISRASSEDGANKNTSRKRKCAVESSSVASTSDFPKRLKNCDPEVWRDAPVVYTDGACSNNGRCDAKAGYGVFWGKNHADNLYGPVFGAPTNNRGELQAVDQALKQAINKKLPAIVLRTDSKLLINSLDNYMDKWKRNSWKTVDGKDVLNQDLLRSIDESTRKILVDLTLGIRVGLKQYEKNMQEVKVVEAKLVKVKFEYVAGHSGDFGNDAADELARRGAQMYTAQRSM